MTCTAGASDGNDCSASIKRIRVPAPVKKNGLCRSCFLLSWMRSTLLFKQYIQWFCASARSRKAGKGRMLTLKELKNNVTEASPAERVPTYKVLRESGIPVVVKKVVDVQSELMVYQNGYVVYKARKRSTVFPLHSCGGYRYEFHQNLSFSVKSDFFEHENWYIRLFLEGEDRIAKNEDWYNGRKSISYSAIAEDWSELAQEDTVLNAFVIQEELEELWQLMTERQRMVMKKYYMEQLQEDEIAKELGITQQAVSDTLRKAIRRVRKKNNMY